MNRSNVEHVLIALVIQAMFGSVIYLLTGGVAGWAVGAVAAIFLFLGREHAQREYKIGNPSELVGYEALDFRQWTRDELMDLLCPAAAVVLATFIAIAVAMWPEAGPLVIPN